MHRFDMHGQPRFEGDALPLLGQQPEDTWTYSDVFDPGAVTLRTVEFVNGGDYRHTMYKFASDGTDLWGTDGRVLIDAGVFSPRLIPDEQDGLLLAVRDNSTQTWTTTHLDNELAELATGQPEWTHPERPDGHGGSLTLFSNVGSPEVGIRVSAQKWDAGVFHAWMDSTVILDINVGPSPARQGWTVTDDGGMIGIVTTNFGAIFYRVSPAGMLGDPPSAARDISSLPATISLHQNYPNPFNPTTTISFSLPFASHATLKIFDVTGRAVRTLIESPLRSGDHSIEFAADNLATGIYFYRLQTGELSLSRKMTLVK
jgi:hypothetical protein